MVLLIFTALTFTAFNLDVLEDITMTTTEEDNTPRNLIVEDDERLAMLTQDYLVKNGLEVAIETDGNRAIRRIVNEQPDMVVLDVMLPGSDGLTVCREVRPHYQNPILMLTARTEDMDQVLGLEMGADDYIAKPFEPRELLARIRAVIRRHEQPNQADSQSDSLTFGRLSVFPDSHEVTIDDQPVRLTTHQFQLLHYFATHSGKVLNREQLWQAMPNDDSSDNIDRAIDVHISRLRALIEDNPRQPKRIITVRGVGYQFATDQV